MRALLMLLILVPACSADPAGSSLGAPCLSHDECASGLCTTPPLLEAGVPDGGMPAKRCTPSSV